MGLMYMYSAVKRAHECGQLVRNLEVNVLCRKEGSLVWPVGEMLWG